jgi:2-keto-4-pentenoate hydratase/2-oxohepta-3-ene-1,7-dioic acid hydratase in catechol pathway
MRLIRFIADDGRTLHGEDLGDSRAAVLDGSIFDTPRRGGEIAGIKRLLAPVEPPNIICVGRNYGDAARAARKGDETLEVFLKPTTALHPPDEPIALPRFDGADGQLDPQLDCEGELAIVIARATRNVSEAQALDCVLGYTLANDITARLFQTPSGPPLWMRGKGFDGFCPLGPCIVTRDEIPDPQTLTLRTLINGVITREASTREMVWSVAEIIACLSRHMTLLPDTVILTGAPVAIANQAMRPGSHIVAGLIGLLTLRNPVVAS